MLNNLQNTPQIGEGYKKTRFRVDNELVDNGYLAQFRREMPVYLVLKRHENATTHWCFPSYETIMRESGIKNKNTVIKYTNTLERLGLIWVERSRGRLANTYHLLPCANWQPLNPILFDAVPTVSKGGYQRYQSEQFNSVCSDTPNQQYKLTKEVNPLDLYPGPEQYGPPPKRTPEEQEQVDRSLAEIRKSLNDKGIMSKRVATG